MLARLALAFISFVSTFSLSMSSETDYLRFDQNDLPRLTEAGASHLASLALHCIGREYPNKIGHVMESDADQAPPRELHPAFYGCYDWHSSVHGHWMLIRLLKEFPELPEADKIRAAISQNLQPHKIQGEVDYMTPRTRKSFQRTYGWTWLLKLAEELKTWEDPQAREWATALQPLVDHIEALYIEFLPKQTYPIRTGVHPNTAFGLSFAWDYAHTLNRTELKAAIEEAALRYYSNDKNCPAHYEPSGSDFLSACLEEANLMQRILSPEKFADWYSEFLPQLPQILEEPATVTDRMDGQLVHLDGLNLSRAWCLAAIAQKLPPDSPHKKHLRQVAATHIQVTLPNIASGGYEGEHWLASFAVYALSVAGR
ncbi:DUF2891 domain-containing protein [Pelagicoccus mobilis]|uniref:DUF2891 domain-containing protein n=1 Tax=Pelagicoccus mobilis TaxID=415221 RepID=A0A934RXN2_9BACT|nr:DUF2891 domain-containing protein [Pelagicoccus mobilis]MBK1879625.1 DUF2891 domain-containing protein [Pelagicoccus mobilis]